MTYLLKALQSAVLTVALLLAANATARADGDAPKVKVDGLWDAPGARIGLKLSGGKVKGVVVSTPEGSPLKRGDKAFLGTLDEDNLTGDLLLAVAEPKCPSGKAKAYVVLLVTKSGKITGGASSKEECAANLSAITMHTAPDSDAPTAAAEAPGQYGADGKRSVPMIDNVRDLLKDAQQYMNEGQFEKARDQFQAALAKDTTVGETYNGIGATYAARNDWDSAIDWYKKGLEASPGFGDLYYNLACAYSMQDKAPLAIRFLKLAAAKGYTEVSALDEDHDLDPIRNDPDFAAIRTKMGGVAKPAPVAPAPAATPAVAPATAAAPTAPTPASTPAAAPAAPAPATTPAVAPVPTAPAASAPTPAPAAPAPAATPAAAPAPATTPTAPAASDAGH